MNIAAYAVAGAAFFVSIKPAPTNLLLLVCLLAVLVGRQTRTRFVELMAHPVGWGSITFFALLCLSQLYSVSSWAQAADYVTKYARLAYIPFLAAALLMPKDAYRVLYAFLAGVLLTLVLSYLNAYVPDFCLNVGLEGCGPPDNPFVFKSHITHGFFMAVGAGLLAFFAHQLFMNKGRVGLVVLLFALALAAAINVLLMIDGRTGWLVFLIFPAVLLARRIGWKGLVLAAVLGSVVLVAMGLFLPEVRVLVDQAHQEYQTWLASGGVSAGRSGMRLTYYARAIEAIALQPWFGYGLGGVENALNLKGVAGGIFALNNPHNQYLLFSLQVGLVGVLVYLVYYASVMRHTLIHSPMPAVVWSFFVAFAVGNLFNSFHFDMSEGVLFALGVAVFWSLSLAAHPKR
ncbi:MAG: O-antigen ligase family protein [Limnobacter sp.]|uniref:O-antigen ligase family protein n=1 Tax=Limnobacter sp. TaxID=2003368 RepID=UPI0022C48A74|nr:O-antigen ligase family protein [Limnobacter sp.]MCZ8016506.1 O-antigen ligase family protein [Limnobacter sp.]